MTRKASVMMMNWTMLIRLSQGISARFVANSGRIENCGINVYRVLDWVNIEYTARKGSKEYI